MEAKFTPGPWVIDAGFDGSGDFNQYWQVHDGSDAIVCSTMFCMAGNKEANAHLIAAAPDLYEALSDLLFLCSQTADACGTQEVKVAYTALAKAKGENPET